MVKVIGVRFRNAGKIYYFAPGKYEIKSGQHVIVETAQGLEYAQCAEGNHEVPDEQVVEPFRPMVRIATDHDRRVLERNRAREKEAFDVCQKKILQHKLEMKLVRVECSFDGNKILFFFTADGRVDFRELVKDLASAFRARIELRQIGVRDEAKMLGGLGICGRPFCCAQFLDEFQPVSIKMAKTQNLSLNPTKISGACGRLMCCLKYEQDAYEDLVKHAPKQESFVETPDGAGTVSSVNLLRQTVQVRLDSAPESPKCYHNCELCVIRSGKGKRPDDYVQPPLEELAKLRRSAEEDQAKKEADALTVALENAFPGRPAKELRQPEPAPDQGEERPAKPRRSRPRRPRPQGEDQAQSQDRNQGQPRQDQRPSRQEPSGEGKKPEFRRRPPRRPQEGSGEPRQQPVQPLPQRLSRPKNIADDGAANSFGFDAGQHLCRAWHRLAGGRRVPEYRFLLQGRQAEGDP